eukprot:227249-Pyramimonas_sp.AAC.1
MPDRLPTLCLLSDTTITAARCAFCGLRRKCTDRVEFVMLPVPRIRGRPSRFQWHLAGSACRAARVQSDGGAGGERGDPAADGRAQGGHRAVQNDPRGWRPGGGVGQDCADVTPSMSSRCDRPCKLWGGAVIPLSGPRGPSTGDSTIGAPRREPT